MIASGAMMKLVAFQRETLARGGGAAGRWLERRRRPRQRAAAPFAPWMNFLYANNELRREGRLR